MLSTVSFRSIHTKQNHQRQVAVFSELTTTSKAIGIMTAISELFSKNELSWQKLIGVCTDGAPAMLGSRSRFVQLVREKNHNVIYCFIHCQALAAETLSNEINDVLQLGIKKCELW